MNPSFLIEIVENKYKTDPCNFVELGFSVADLEVGKSFSFGVKLWTLNF